MKTLVEFYKSIGEAVGVVSDNQGFMSTIYPGGDTPKPWTVDSQRIVLPTPEQLKQPDWSNRIGFHPLLQNVVGGESRVMDKFRDRMNGYSDFVLGTFMHDVAKLAMRETMHQDLTPDQAAYLAPFSDVDKTFTELIYNLTTAKRITKKNHEFVRFTVIKGRVWEGQKRMRVAGLHFPLYEQLPKDNKGTTLLGFKLRQKDVRMLRAMYHHLFPGITDKGYFEFGSDSKIGPSIEALMTVYGMFAEAINKAVSILEPVIDSSTALLIPMLEGNSPSERIVQASAPRSISMETQEAPAVRAGTIDTAPTISAAMSAHIDNQTTQQGVAQMQETNATHSRPRIKLGVRSATVDSVNPSHQLPNTVGNVAPTQTQTPTMIAYARPAPSGLPPTPPVGAMLQEQRVAQGLIQPNSNVLPVQTQMVQQATVQAVKIPDSVRMVGNTMYIPLEMNGVAAAPAGMILIEGRPYIPYGAPAVASPVMANAGLGIGARPGIATPQAITDPGQVPGLSAEEIQYYRMNPVMWQNVLAQLQNNSLTAANNVLAARQQAIPRYLQNAVQTAQSQQQQTMGLLGGRRLIG
jgi:hypothetical protein